MINVLEAQICARMESFNFLNNKIYLISIFCVMKELFQGVWCALFDCWLVGGFLVNLRQNIQEGGL